MTLELVALDADDTLWHNEPLYINTRERLSAMIARYEPSDTVEERLYETELRNLRHFGYGVKGFVLSMIETAIELTNGRLESGDVRQIIDWGREMLCCPVELLDGVRDTVEELSASYRLVLLTKGDLLHQESKLASSGLGSYFKGIEIVSEKTPQVYRTVIARYAVRPDAFVMVGDSLRSDVLPVLEAGGHAIHVPYATTWVHERVPPEHLTGLQYHEISHIRDLPATLARVAQA